MTLQSIEPLAEHAQLWGRLQRMFDSNRVAHALLFVAPRHASLTQFTARLTALLLCQDAASPCGSCRSCRWIQRETHPDVHHLHQDSLDKSIKIEQVRLLQETIYQTPQQGARRIILIERADKLNQASANALLKILEEPPLHSVFILMAEHLATLPATIISRCQRVLIPAEVDLNQPMGYLALGESYAESTERAKLSQQQDSILQGLVDLAQRTTSPCILAAAWSSYVLDDLVWFLYLIIAQLVRLQLTQPATADSPNQQLTRLRSYLKPMNLFSLLEQLNAIKRKIDKNIAINSTLAIESFLINLQRVM